MADEAELQARIDALAGKINYHKQQPNPYHAPQHSAAQRGRGRGRWAPYARGGRQQTFQNPKWIAGGSEAPTSPPPPAGINTGVHMLPADGTASGGDYVYMRGAGKMELWNKAAYQREREQKQKQEYPQPRSMISQNAPSNPPSAPAPVASPREIVLQGLRFTISEDGSKLTRISGKLLEPGRCRRLLNAADASTAQQETPKKTEVAGVTFTRTKNGNLIRARALQASRYRCSKSWLLTRDALNIVDRTTASKPKTQCETFTKNGTLPSQHSHHLDWKAKSPLRRRLVSLP